MVYIPSLNKEVTLLSYAGSNQTGHSAFDAKLDNNENGQLHFINDRSTAFVIRSNGYPTSTFTPSEALLNHALFLEKGKTKRPREQDLQAVDFKRQR